MKSPAITGNVFILKDKRKDKPNENKHKNSHYSHNFGNSIFCLVVNTWKYYFYSRNITVAVWQKTGRTDYRQGTDDID
jgi:hypothetical protein